MAVRDDGLADSATRAHLDDCESCRSLLVEIEGRSNLISEALSSLDDPVDIGRAKSVVRARLDRARAERPAPAWRRWHLGRAAAILLLSAGAVSALPWSPVRSWWSGPATEPDTPDTGAVPPVQSPGAQGIAVDVTEGRITVVVTGAAPGSQIDVTWVEGTTARITAPPGSSFSYADGRAEAEVLSGTVAVELPRAAEAVLEVDGAVYLRRSPAGVATPGPALDVTEEGIRFRVPGG